MTESDAGTCGRSGARNHSGKTIIYHSVVQAVYPCERGRETATGVHTSMSGPGGYSAAPRASATNRSNGSTDPIVLVGEFFRRVGEGVALEGGEIPLDDLLGAVTP
jgi:hypothetical protein